MSVLQCINLLPCIIIYIYIILTYDSIVACCIQIISQIQFQCTIHEPQASDSYNIVDKISKSYPFLAQKLFLYRSLYFCTNAYLIFIDIYIWGYIIKAVSWTLYVVFIRWLNDFRSRQSSTDRYLLNRYLYCTLRTSSKIPHLPLCVAIYILYYYSIYCVHNATRCTRPTRRLSWADNGAAATTTTTTPTYCAFTILYNIIISVCRIRHVSPELGPNRGNIKLIYCYNIIIW